MLRLSRTLVVIVLGSIGASACTQQTLVPPRTFQSDAGAVTVKGSLHKQRLCLTVQLESADAGVSLQSLQIVDAEGSAHPPATWTDRTSEAAETPIRGGPGTGFSRGGHLPASRQGWDRSLQSRMPSDLGPPSAAPRQPDIWGPSPRPRQPLEAGPGTDSPIRSGPSAAYPLNSGKSGAKVRAAEACWDLAGKTADLAACTMEVKLVSVLRDKIEVTTIPLTMTVVTSQEPGSKPSAGKGRDETPASPRGTTDPIAEIDFTLKAQPTKKVMPT